MTEESRFAAIRIALGGIARGADLDDVGDELRLLHPKHNTFPGETLLELAADALELGGADRAHPIEYSGLRERFLPEYQFRGRTDHSHSHYALRAVAMIRAGLTPDYLDEIRWWHSDDFWLWAFFALTIYVRAVAEHSGTSVDEICRASPRLGESSSTRELQLAASWVPFRGGVRAHHRGPGADGRRAVYPRPPGHSEHGPRPIGGRPHDRADPRGLPVPRAC